MSEGDHCHVIYEDRNKYREQVCSLMGQVNKRQEIKPKEKEKKLDQEQVIHLVCSQEKKIM